MTKHKLYKSTTIFELKTPQENVGQYYDTVHINSSKAQTNYVCLCVLLLTTTPKQKHQLILIINKHTCIPTSTTQSAYRHIYNILIPQAYQFYIYVRHIITSHYLILTDGNSIRKGCILQSQPTIIHVKKNEGMISFLLQIPSSLQPTFYAASCNSTLLPMNYNFRFDKIFTTNNLCHS